MPVVGHPLMGLNGGHRRSRGDPSTADGYRVDTTGWTSARSLSLGLWQVFLEGRSISCLVIKVCGKLLRRTFSAMLTTSTSARESLGKARSTLKRGPKHADSGIDLGEDIFGVLAERREKHRSKEDESLAPQKSGATEETAVQHRVTSGASMLLLLLMCVLQGGGADAKMASAE
jgi:hypothetical protein